MSSDVLKDFIILNVYYDTINAVVSSTSERVTFFTLLANIGGQMGEDWRRRIVYGLPRTKASGSAALF